MSRKQRAPWIIVRGNSQSGRYVAERHQRGPIDDRVDWYGSWPSREKAEHAATALNAHEAAAECDDYCHMLGCAVVVLGETA